MNGQVHYRARTDVILGFTRMIGKEGTGRTRLVGENLLLYPSATSVMLLKTGRKVYAHHVFTGLTLGGSLIIHPNGTFQLVDWRAVHCGVLKDSFGFHQPDKPYTDTYLLAVQQIASDPTYRPGDLRDVRIIQELHRDLIKRLDEKRHA